MTIQNVIEINADLKVNVVKIGSPTIVQNDNVKFVVSITEKGEPLTATQLAVITDVSLASTSPGNTTVVTSGTLDGSKAVFDLGTSEMAYPGKVNAMVQLYEGTERVSTFSFNYYVLKDPTGAEYVPSETEMTLIQTVMTDAQAKIDELAALDVVQLDAEVTTARGTEASLGARLDSTDAQLAQKATIKSFLEMPTTDQLAEGEIGLVLVSELGISSVYPTDGATSTDIYMPITLSFTDPMNETTINSTNITVSNGTSNIVGEVVYDNVLNKALFYPSNYALTTNTKYVVTAQNLVKANGILVKTKTISFTTQTTAMTLVVDSPMDDFVAEGWSISSSGAATQETGFMRLSDSSDTANYRATKGTTTFSGGRSADFVVALSGLSNTTAPMQLRHRNDSGLTGVIGFTDNGTSQIVKDAVNLVDLLTGIDLSKKHHYRIVTNSGVVTLYIDGELTATNLGTLTETAWLDTISFMTDNSGTVSAADLYHARVFNSAYGG